MTDPIETQSDKHRSGNTVEEDSESEIVGTSEYGDDTIKNYADSETDSSQA